jgi:hypothetical protein
MGDKVTVSIDVGRRSFLGRWVEPEGEITAANRMTPVDDPTELRKPVGALPQSVAAVHKDVSSEQTAASKGSDGG